jgi:NADH dehydrogenase [ubiquinone] 1 alpha subcomplex assembly factor 1
VTNDFAYPKPKNISLVECNRNISKFTIYESLIANSLLSMAEPFTLFDFSEDSDLKNWTVVNDGVMGGMSKGDFTLNKEGHALFMGKISLENYGGFSMVQYKFESKLVKGFKKLILRLKGDGKKYQVRVKTSNSDDYSYIAYITTNGKWQTLEILLTEMAPWFRGNKLNIPNYPGEYMEQFAILIGNKKKENFELYMDKIVLE